MKLATFNAGFRQGKWLERARPACRRIDLCYSLLCFFLFVYMLLLPLLVLLFYYFCCCCCLLIERKRDAFFVSFSLMLLFFLFERVVRLFIRSFIHLCLWCWCCYTAGFFSLSFCIPTKLLFFVARSDLIFTRLNIAV